ncbi:MAG: hypothetical protein HYZ91_06075, partial [Candidatus Omnitrophica bacterium]|nr:hypothetical protein [Candidatus Omnitrophota bacterium]
MTAVTNFRPELANRLRQQLDAFREGFRHNLAILGPPGSGKTFQLQNLLAQPLPQVLPIYCPLYRESCRSFLQRFLSAVLRSASPDLNEPTGGPPSQSLGALDSMIKTAPVPFDALLQHAEGRVPRTVEAIRAVEGLITRRLYGEAFNRALDTIPILLGERGGSCVLILDEFLCLEALGLGHAFHELGKRVMTWPSTLFILSSSSIYRARSILRERLQLLFGQFELLTLDAIDPDPTTSWIRQELKGIRGVEAIVPFLIRWLGTYPWYLVVFLKRLRELASLSTRPSSIELLFFQTAWDVLGATEGPLHQWCVSRMEGCSHGRLGTRATEALIHIAGGVRTTTELSKRIGRSGLAEALQRLAEQDLVQRKGMCWVVPDPVLRCWLSTILASQRSDLRLGPVEVRARFEQSLRSLWTQWTHAQQLSFSEQVVRLFTAFCDDTVVLDSKTGRLPKFETINTHRPHVAGVEAYLIADGQGKRWCATVQAEPIDENAIASFEAFCRAQTPKPSRKVVIVKSC